MLKSVGSKVVWVGRITSRFFGPVMTFRAAFLAILAVALSYGTALLAVLYLYRQGYGIVGKPELALRSMAKSIARVRS